jgi:hypothetical protein
MGLEPAHAELSLLPDRQPGATAAPPHNARDGMTFPGRSRNLRSGRPHPDRFVLISYECVDVWLRNPCYVKIHASPAIWAANRFGAVIR